MTATLTEFVWKKGCVSTVLKGMGLVDATDFDDETGAEPAIETLVEGDALFPIGTHKRSIDQVYRCIMKMGEGDPNETIVINGKQHTLPATMPAFAKDPECAAGECECVI